MSIATRRLRRWLFPDDSRWHFTRRLSGVDCCWKILDESCFDCYNMTDRFLKEPRSRLRLSILEYCWSQTYVIHDYLFSIFGHDQSYKWILPSSLTAWGYALHRTFYSHSHGYGAISSQKPLRADALRDIQERYLHTSTCSTGKAHWKISKSQAA